MDLTLRPGRPEDAELCGRICYEAFKTIAEQHNFPPDFPSPEVAAGMLAAVLPRDDVYSVVAELDGQIVGSNFLWLSELVAGVGPITIDPAIQNRRVGRALMGDVLDFARDRGVPAVRLVQAAYHNRSFSLYAKLGFEIREPLATIQGGALGLRLPGYDVRPAVEGDLAACNALCHAIHGHDRSGELLGAIRQGTATVVEHNGRITGYATVVGFLGHTVGETNRELMALIGAAPEFAGPGFLLPSRNGELLRWCLAQGLHVVQPMTLMTRGLYSEPAGPFLPSVIY
jgi:predicted N-acetyltransferase YhbS